MFWKRIIVRVCGREMRAGGDRGLFRRVMLGVKNSDKEPMGLFSSSPLMMVLLVVVVAVHAIRGRSHAFSEDSFCYELPILYRWLRCAFMGYTCEQHALPIMQFATEQ